MWNVGNPLKPKGATMMNYVDFINSQSDENILSHPDIQQRMIMLMGGDKDNKLELTKQEETQVAQHYLKMCYSLATIRWCRGETLGVARQKSLEQMDNFVKSKTNIANPVNKYLLSIHGRVSREFAEQNMTNPDSNENVKLHPVLAQKWSDQATKEFQKSLQILNEIHKKYMPEKNTENNPDTKSFNMAQQNVQKMLQQILLQQQMTDERAA